ncbi:MAG: acyl-CoA dehydrogenase [Rhodospirillales bacterium]|nr:acyl-CoA dehydrogenase [Rhodospirillales bacterium]
MFVASAEARPENGVPPKWVIDMEFTPTEEQAMFRDAVSRFAQEHLAPGAQARAGAEGYPWDVAQLMAGQGLLGITIAEEDGGQGGTLMDAVIAVEEVARWCPGSVDVVHAGSFGAIRTLAAFGSPEQKKRFLPSLLAGNGLIAIAMSEPEAGSAVTELNTSATPDGDGFRINGSKVFVTFSPEATLFLVYVRFGPGTDGIGSVLIERGTPGFSLGAPNGFMSGDSWQQLYFEDCPVGPENVLAGEGGFKRQIAGFNAERIGNSVRSLALGRHAFELARAHALERRQFGRLLCEFQGIQWKFADAAVDLEAAGLLLYRAAANADKGLPSAHDTALAKLACNRAGFAAANEAVQVLGGLGFSEPSLAEYCLRRTRGWMIAGGSIEMMKNRIAEGVFERRFSQRPPRATDPV